MLEFLLSCLLHSQVTRNKVLILLTIMGKRIYLTQRVKGLLACFDHSHFTQNSELLELSLRGKKELTHIVSNFTQ